MQLTTDILILLIVLACVTRLSLWPLRWRLAYSVALGAFAWWSLRYAVVQSKVQLAALMADTQVQQGMAVLVTLDSAVSLYASLSGRLRWFPPLLMVPVTFYLLTMTLFTLTGVDFSLTALLFALAVAALLPLLAEGLRRLLPDAAGRGELFLLLTVVVCLIGLLATQQHTLVYVSNNNSYMEYISRALFGIANSLLIPDILLLIFFFIRALVLLAQTYRQFMARRSGQGTPLYTKYLNQLTAHDPSEAYADYVVSQFEAEAAKDVNLSRLLTKLGPVLGLIGTLISMSPALVGLSTGDISGMAYNMQVVFSATVVGLVISAVGLFTQQLKARWYAVDMSRLEYESQKLQEAHEPQEA